MQEQNQQQAKQLYEAGELGPAVEALSRELKSHPSDPQRRTFLFELLCLSGEWERAAKQLDIISQLSADSELGAQVYRNCIKAEFARRRLFDEGLAPYFLTEPPAYVDLHLDALNHLREGDAAAARATLDSAESLRPARSGTRDGRPFREFRDYDDLLAPVLELIVLDKYTWLPVEQVVRMSVEPPTRLRDIIWVNIKIETRERKLSAFMPGLYVNSSAHADDRVRLGRMTDWVERGGELYSGAGLRLFAVDGEEMAALDMGSVEFMPGPGGEPQETAGA